MSEAIKILEELRDRIAGEKWADPRGKAAVLTGIKMSIARLENTLSDRPDAKYLYGYEDKIGYEGS